MQIQPDAGNDSRSRQQTGAPPLLVALIALILGAAFFVNEVDWQVSTYDNYTLEADDTEALVVAGSSKRKVTYAVIALLGMLLLWAPSRQPRQFVSLTMLLLAGYVATCVVSVAWSDAPMLSLKRAAVLCFCMLGVLGVAKHLNARNLLNVAVAVAIFLVGMSFATELALGTFQPLAADYRFAGTVHPNTQGAYCAVMAIAAFFGARASRGGRWFYVLVFAAGVAFLLLTKSRASCAGCLLALSAAWLLSAGRVGRVFAGVGGPLAVCLILIAALLSGREVVGDLDRAARLGRTSLDSSVEGLNGRLPLWQGLLEHVAERPLLGYGYHGFWTPTRIHEVSDEHEWTIATAHSVFIDVLLSIGVIGGLFFAAAVVLALARAAHRCLRVRAEGDAFVLALALFAVVSGIFESGFAQPAGFDSFIAASGLLYAVMLPGRLEIGATASHGMAPAGQRSWQIATGAGGV